MVSPHILKKDCFLVLRSLAPRAREVIERRFGLVNGKKETLESIGRDFGVTRERVRQIESEALRRLREQIKRENLSFIQKYYHDWLRSLRIHGNIQREDIFLEDIGGRQMPYVLFLLHLNDSFTYFPETEDFYGAWSCNTESMSGVVEVVNILIQRLEALGKSLGDRELVDVYRQKAPQKGLYALHPRVIFSYASLSKRIGRGLHGLWGLREWPEISPRGLRDRAYLVYKRERKPLHFVDVARLIEHYGFNPKGRKVLVQSVHNDLIRDPRFVLIGRGIYALKEWGYTSGVVRDVIAHILEQADTPLSAEEIVTLVLKQRRVKTTTILLNLQNKKYFARTPEGKYMLAKTQETTLA